MVPGGSGHATSHALAGPHLLTSVSGPLQGVITHNVQESNLSNKGQTETASIFPYFFCERNSNA
jgi:hypothetical protein